MQSENSVEFAYGQLHGHSCAISPQCQRRATKWLRDEHIWLCDRCYGQYRKRHRDVEKNKQQTADKTTADSQRKKASPEQLLTWVRNERAKNPTRIDDRQENRNCPNQIASVVSYMTLSRYGDIVLRSFAYYTLPADPDEHFQNKHWQYEALAALTVFLIGLLATTGLILC